MFKIILLQSLVTAVFTYSFVPSRTIYSGNVPFMTPKVSPSTRTVLEMKVSKGKSKHSKSNSLHTINQHRKRIAGKPGSKHFLDPNKVFIGNLSYDTNVDEVKEFLNKHLGGLHTVESVKIVVDWKTNKSKGFGFIQFIEPIFATSAMESIRNKKLKGRVIRLDQGRKKDDLENRVLFVKKRERKNDEEENVYVDADEDSVINEALDEAESEEDMEYSLDDFDDDEDELLFGGDVDDDDEEFDGWFEEVYGGSKWEELDEEEAMNMNREQRRKAQRMMPKKKLPKKGFS